MGETDANSDRIDIDLSHPWLVLIALFTIVSVTALAYSNSLEGSWGLDDYPGIVENEQHNKEGQSRKIEKLTWSSLYGAATSKPERERWITNVSFALNYYFHGLDKTGYHLFNIIVHGLAALGLFFFVYELFWQFQVRSGDPSSEGEENRERARELALETAWMTALLWAVHPVLTQSVNYVVQRGVILSGMFYMWGLYAYLSGRKRTGRGKWILYGATLFLAACAIKSKEVTGTFFLAILLLEWICLPGLPGSYLPESILDGILHLFDGVFPESFDRKKKIWTVYGFFIVFLFIAVALYLIGGIDGIQKRYQQFMETEPGSRRFTVRERIMTEWRVMIFYLSLLLYPGLNRMNLEHDITVSSSLLDPWTTFVALLIILGLLLAAFLYRKKSPVLSLGIFWFFLHLAVTSTFINLELIFEHRLYLSAMAPVLVLSWYFVRWLPIQFQVRVVWVMILCAVLGWTTFQRNKVWQSQVSLYRDAVLKTSSLPENGKNDQITVEVEVNGNTRQLVPSKPRNVGNLAVAKYRKAKRLIKQKKHEKAFDLIYEAVELHKKTLMMSEQQKRPIDQIFIRNLDDLLIRLTKVWKNIEDRKYTPNWTVRIVDAYRKILSLPQKYTERRKALLQNLMRFHMHLAELYYQKGMYKKVEENLLQILKIHPEHPMAHYRLAVLYKKKRPNRKKFLKHGKKAMKLVDDKKLKSKIRSFLNQAKKKK